MRRLAAAAEPLRNPEAAFQRSPRNLEAEKRLAPLVDAAFPAARGCGCAFECRGPACRIELDGEVARERLHPLRGEPLLIPDKMPEGKKLNMDDRYRKLLESAFRSTLAQVRD